MIHHWLKPGIEKPEGVGRVFECMYFAVDVECFQLLYHIIAPGMHAVDSAVDE